MKHVVITGATRGLGRAMAMGFAADGWTVSGCGTHADALRSFARELGPEHLVQPCEVTDSAAVESFASFVVDHSGAPDLLLNNAGLTYRSAPLWGVPDNDLFRVIDVNLKGVYHVIRSFVPAMIQRGKGVVVNFSSSWSRRALSKAS